MRIKIHHENRRQQGVAQWVLLVALLTASAVAGFFAYLLTLPSEDELKTVADRAALEQIILKDPDGTDHSLGQWSGRPQIVNYWATWCAPCREEMPVLVDLHSRYADKGLAILGLSMDYPEDTELVKQFMAEQKVEYPVLMAADYGNKLATLYGAENFVLPISIFVRANGEVSQIHTGLLTAEQAEEFLKTTW